MAEPQVCKKCEPGHYHLDHSFQSFTDEDDLTGEPLVVMVYSCKICPCETRAERIDLDAFKGMVMAETGLAM